MALSRKPSAAFLLVIFLYLGSSQGRMLKQAANTRQASVSTANYTPETMRPVTSSSRTSSAAGTRPIGAVSIDGSTAMAGGQQTQSLQSLRNVTPSGYAPLAQTQKSGTASTDQATVGPVRPISSNGTPANVEASRASSQNMETMDDAGSAMSMRQLP